MNKVIYEKMIDEKLAMLKEEMMQKFEEGQEDDFPKVGDDYWYICTDGEIYHDTWNNYPIDIGRFSMGNIFLTEKEAEFEAERRKVIKELKKYAEPENKEWDMENIHWTYRYDFSTKEVCCDWLKLVKYNGIYFANLERAEKALEAVGEYRVKKYYLRVED